MKTTFPTAWREGTPFHLPLHAHDPEGHSLAFEVVDLDGNPVSEDISIDQSGNISWATPTEGFHEFLVRAIEQFNPHSFAEQPLRFYVFDTDINFEPIIIGNPHDSLASTNSEFDFQFQVNDPDQPAHIDFEFNVIGGPNDNLPTIDPQGIFSWTPRATDLGRHAFQIAVTDSHSVLATNTRYLTFELQVAANELPVITSTDSLEAAIATTFVHRIDAHDPDGDQLEYALVDAGIATDVFINQTTGELRWQVSQ